MNFSAWSLEDENLTIRKVPFYNDEPKIFQYVADLSSLHEPDVQFRGYGSDFVKEAARLKAAVEAIERRSLASLSQGPLKKGKTTDLDLPFVPPLDLQHFTPEQLNSPRFDRMLVHDDSEFRWIRGTNALNAETAYLPAQAVIFPYPDGEEPILRFPSTNGAASGCSLAEARCRGVFEIIERDSFMCWYLTAVPAKRLDIRKSGFSPDVAEIFDRYGLELQLLLLPSQWLEYPVVLAVIIDSSGVGPCLTAGLKCHPCLQTAVMGAIAEAQQKRPWLRDHMWLYGLPDPGERHEVCDFWGRAFFWAAPGRNREISFLWEESNVLTLEENVKKREPANDDPDWNGMWNTIVGKARDKGFDLFVVDINGPSNGEHTISTVKIVIPQAHSVYMDEGFQYLRSVSITNARETFGPRWGQSSEDDPVNMDIPPHFFC